MVAPDRFERLLAEAEECIRARSVSPCMLKGMPGPGTSPTCNMPAARPITPLQLGMNAMDAANARGALPRSLLGVELQPQQDGPQGIAAFMLPAAAMPGRTPPAAAEANSPEGDADDAAAGQQDSPSSQVGVGAGSAASLGHHAEATDAPYGAAGAGAGSYQPHGSMQCAGQEAPGQVEQGPMLEYVQDDAQVGGRLQIVGMCDSKLNLG